MENQIQILKFDELTEAAKKLSTFVKKNGLSVQIANKDYVMVDGWQYLGAQFGLFPIVKLLKPLPTTDGSIKYKCVVELKHMASGNIMSVGVAYCTNIEPKKTSFAEYAIASMAQTRAIGKAYRNILGWVAKAGGFESTPYEEMEDKKAEAANREVLKTKIYNTLDARIKAIKTKEDAATVKKIIETNSRSKTLNKDQIQKLLDNLAEKADGIEGIN